jgi:hypothetical protein
MCAAPGCLTTAPGPDGAERTFPQISGHDGRPQQDSNLRSRLHMYNHHRGHTALKGQPPASRVTNLSRQYS